MPNTTQHSPLPCSVGCSGLRFPSFCFLGYGGQKKSGDFLARVASGTLASGWIRFGKEGEVAVQFEWQRWWLAALPTAPSALSGRSSGTLSPRTRSCGGSECALKATVMLPIVAQQLLRMRLCHVSRVPFSLLPRPFSFKHHMPSKNAMTKVSKHIEKGVPEPVGCGVLSGTHIPKLGLWVQHKVGGLRPGWLPGGRAEGRRVRGGQSVARLSPEGRNSFWDTPSILGAALHLPPGASSGLED